MMKINIEFTGNMEEITKDFSALASILNGMNNTDTAVVLSSDLSSVPDKTEKDAPDMAMHPTMDAVSAETPKATVKAAPAPETPQQEVPQSDAHDKAKKEEPVKTEQPATAVVPTAPVKEDTLDELLAATAPLMDAGKISELQALMQKFGVPSMMEIPEDRYGELATALRELGAEL